MTWLKDALDVFIVVGLLILFGVEIYLLVDLIRKRKELFQKKRWWKIAGNTIPLIMVLIVLFLAILFWQSPPMAPEIEVFGLDPDYWILLIIILLMIVFGITTAIISVINKVKRK